MSKHQQHVSHSDLSNPANLSHVLGMLVANNTATVKNGEKLLKPFLKHHSCVLALLAQVKESSSPEIRHHAALLVKKKIGAHFPRVGASNQVLIKAEILHILRHEVVKAVNIAVAGCVATLAKSLFSIGGEWPELFMLLLEFSQSSYEMHRLTTFSLLEQLAEHVSTNLVPHLGTISQMLMTGCQDSNLSVSVGAMKATTSFFDALRNDVAVMQLQPVLTPILTVLQQCLQRGEDDSLVEGMEILQQCALLEQPLINDHIEAIVQFTLVILQNDDCESSVRQSAGQTLMNVMEGRPKLVAKKQLVVPTLSVLANIIAKSDTSAAGSLFSFEGTDGRLDHEKDTDQEDEDFAPEMDIARLAQIVIDVMATHIPQKHFVEPALNLCAQGMQSPDPHMRKAGCALLGVIAEGCRDAIRQLLPSIMPPLLTSVQDPEFFVREVAMFALGQFSEHCQPEILHYHASVLPVIFNALDDSRNTVQSTACYVLEMFCENLLRETLRPFLEPLLGKLAKLLKSEKHITQEMALSAIAATAVAAEIDFLPYAEGVCNTLAPLLFTTEADQLSVRGRSLECWGHVAVAIGAEHFARFFDVGMKSAMQAIEMDNDDLKEHSYVYFANSSKVMGKGFDPYLTTVLPHLKSVIDETELVFGSEEGSEAEEEEVAHGDDEGAANDDDDSQDIHINAQDGFVNNKKAALTAIGSIAQHTKESFFPYLEQFVVSMVAPQGAVHSFHGAIRGEAVSIMQYFVESACAAHGLNPAKKGEQLQLPPVVFDLCKICLENALLFLEEDEEKQPVSEALESISGIVTQIGLVAFSIPVGDESNKSPLGTRLMNVTNNILQEKAPCQVSEKLENEDGEEDDDNHDNIVMDALTDLIGVFARVLGEGFVPYFDVMLSGLLRFVKDQRIHSDRSMAIGCFAEVLDEIGPMAIKYLDIVLPIIQKGLADSMEPVRRNSAFCLGVLVQSTGSSLVPHFGHILQWLYPLCTRPEEKQRSDAGGADVDNAVSAVARMIKIAPDAVPMGVVLPVLLQALPLRSDAVEGENVYGCLIDLVQSGHTAAMANLVGILRAFGQALTPNSILTNEAKTMIVSCLKSIASQPQVGAAMASIGDVGIQQILSDAIRS